MVRCIDDQFGDFGRDLLSKPHLVSKVLYLEFDTFNDALCTQKPPVVVPLSEVNLENIPSLKDVDSLQEHGIGTWIMHIKEFNVTRFVFFGPGTGNENWYCLTMRSIKEKLGIVE